MSVKDIKIFLSGIETWPCGIFSECEETACNLRQRQRYWLFTGELQSTVERHSFNTTALNYSLYQSSSATRIRMYQHLFLFLKLLCYLTPCRRIFLKCLPITREFTTLTVPKGSPQSSHNHATGPYTSQFNPVHILPPYLNIHLNIICEHDRPSGTTTVNFLTS